MRSYKGPRDLILFGVGLVGIIHETFFSMLDRPGLLVLYAACMGLPAFLKKDNGS